MITSIVSAWCFPPKAIVLKNDEVHVWRASLDAGIAYEKNLACCLSEDERRQSERFHFQLDREHFIAARSLLRNILGLYLKVEPRKLRFCYGPKGKPLLTREFGEGSVRFNLSHSHGIALYALTQGREIGIDIEYIRPHFADRQVAERFYSPNEVATLNALPTRMQSEAFFACWTRKEAYIKAKGKGLTIPLNSFDVSLAPGQKTALLRVEGDCQEASRWSLIDLYPEDGYAATLAVEGHDWLLKCWQWPGID
jgi:4'-phosphopantetheinyl transferase